MTSSRTRLPFASEIATLTIQRMLANSTTSVVHGDVKTIGKTEMPEHELSIGQCVSLACLLEVMAPKPGNVHRGADFDDCGLVDFASSAVAISPILEKASVHTVGQSVLRCVHATIDVCQTNTNLGIILLLTPLACVPRSVSLRLGIRDVLTNLDSTDARNLFQAIRIANPGGLRPKSESVSKHDVTREVSAGIVEAMSQAADRDLIARQYVNGYADVFDFVLPSLVEDGDRLSLTDRIIRTHLRLMSEFPDSLIRRKCGLDVAVQSATLAGAVLNAGEVESDAYNNALADLDFWLRADGNRRNPGTSADMIAAALFAGLREKQICPPFN